MAVSAKTLFEAVSLDQFQQCLDSNHSLRGYVQGYVSEIILEGKLREEPGVSNVYKIGDRDSRKGDFAFTYEGYEYTIELKSASCRGINEDTLNGGTSYSVVLKNSDSKDVAGDETGSRTTCLPRGQFDILGICMVNVTGKWDFQFILNKYIPSATLGPDFLNGRPSFNSECTPMLKSNILDVLQDMG